MVTTKALFPILAALVLAILATAQQRPPPRMTLDDRLAAIEDRIEMIEDRLAKSEGQSQGARQADPLSSQSEARLDRLEVRVIRIEDSSGDGNHNGMAQRAMLERVRSLERQVARLRSATLR